MTKLAQGVSIGEYFHIRTGEGIASRFPDTGSLGTFITPLLFNAYIAAGVVLLFLLIGGGLTIIINTGQGRSENIAKGQKAVTASLIGFLVIFASYWIIQIIETITGLDII